MSKDQKKQRQHHLSIPERAEVLSYLRDIGRPCSLKQIAKALDADSDAKKGALKNRLKAMVRDGQLIRNRRGGYGLIDKMDLIAGKVIGHADGYGFVVPDSGEGGDLYLSASEMRSVLHGDRVAVRVRGIDRKGRREGALVEILERANTQIVGRYFLEDSIGFVVPDNKRLNHDVLIPKENAGTAKEGDFVLAGIIKQPDKHTQPIGKVYEVLGHHEQAGISTDIAIRAFDLPHVWPEVVDEQINEINVDEALDPKGRKDFRDKAFVTIDGADARDFDDAVYCESTDGGWTLYVAIADVSYYVQPGTALDEEAVNRGTSVYFPDRVIPMLPEILSNELCSLKPQVERLCMVCEMQVDKQGRVKNSRFHDGIMRSVARLTYTEMATLVVDKEESAREKHKEHLNAMDELYTLYKTINKARRKRGLLDFDSTESIMELDKEGRVCGIYASQRNDAHRLIEEFMLAANVCAAEFLLKNEVPVLFRNHDTPKLEKLNDLREFLSELGLTLGGGDEPQSRNYAKLLEQVREREDAHMIKTVLLRSLSLAVYSDENLGHFGLAFDSYTHFTSPIRRYPDLLIHRAIRALISKKGKSSYRSTREYMHSMGVHSSMTERRAEEASRDVVQRMKCEFMHDKVGEVFSGTITSVTSFGLFVELDNVFVEGLVHITALPADYYHYDAIAYRLTGERTGKTYGLTNRIKVKVMRVDIDGKKIDFDLPE